MDLKSFKKDMRIIEDETDIENVKKTALALLYGCASYYQQYVDGTFPLEEARRELRIGRFDESDDLEKNESDNPDDYEFSDNPKAA